MFRRYKNLLIIALSLALTCAVTLICVFCGLRELPYVTAIVGIWTFFIVPSFFACAKWVNEHFDFKGGAFLGIVLGELVFILPILLSPIFGSWWYVCLFSDLKK